MTHFKFYICGGITKFEVDDIIRRQRRKVSLELMISVLKCVYNVSTYPRHISRAAKYFACTGHYPMSFSKQTALINPKGQPSSFRQFRPISLLNVEGAMFSSVLSPGGSRNSSPPMVILNSLYKNLAFHAYPKCIEQQI